MRRPSIASSESQVTRSTIDAVLLLPAPTIMGMRPRTCWLARSASSRSSASFRVADSPVDPPTTTPEVPFSRWKSISRAQASKSMRPSERMGVTMATRLPENIEIPQTAEINPRCYEPMLGLGKLGHLNVHSPDSRVATGRLSRYTPRDYKEIHRLRTDEAAPGRFGDRQRPHWDGPRADAGHQ